MNEASFEVWAQYAADLSDDYEDAACDCSSCAPVPECEDGPTWGCECAKCESQYNQVMHVHALAKGDKRYEGTQRRRRIPTVPRRFRSQRREWQSAEW